MRYIMKLPCSAERAYVWYKPKLVIISHRDSESVTLWHFNCFICQHRDNGQIASITHTMSTPTIPPSIDIPDGFDERLLQRAAVQNNNPLSTNPANESHKPHGNIPNTPLAVSTISFLLGTIFSPAFIACIFGGLGLLSWPYYQLGFFIAAWATFHWGEFAVTAGWNFDKCSVDCRYTTLDRCTTNAFHDSLSIGQRCSVPHCEWNCHRRVSCHILLQTIPQAAPICIYSRQVPATCKSASVAHCVFESGMLVVLFGQALRSAAMIHASTNFSHAVAFRKLDTHRLVTDGVYA